MQIIKEVLQKYGITPMFIEKVTDHFYRIDDGQQIYGLKQSRLTHETLQMWEYTYDQANSNQLKNVLPVCLTKNSKLYTSKNELFYYLTPWIYKNDFTIDALFQTIGKIHASTREKQSIDTKSFEKHWNEYASYSSNYMNKYVAFVEFFEKEHYMSPIGLQVCTHFRHIELILKTLQEQITNFLNEKIESKQWTYCLCHGNLSFSHVRGNKSVYILNWEKSQLNNASFDLSKLFINEIKYADTDTESFITGFKHYMDENELNHQELYLLTINLLDPAKYFSIIDKFMLGKNSTSMIKETKELQYAYRKLLFGLELTKYIKENYTRPKVEDLDLDN